MVERQLTLLGPWLDTSDASRRSDPIPATCNCSFWPDAHAPHDLQARTAAAYGYSDQRPHVHFGVHTRQLVDDLIADVRF